MRFIFVMTGWNFYCVQIQVQLVDAFLEMKRVSLLEKVLLAWRDYTHTVNALRGTMAQKQYRHGSRPACFFPGRENLSGIAWPCRWCVKAGCLCFFRGAICGYILSIQGPSRTPHPAKIRLVL